MEIELDRNKQTAREYLEQGFGEAGRGNRQILDRYFAEGHKLHTARHHDHEASGREATEGYTAAVLGAVKDFKLEVDRIIAEGDQVTALWHVTGVHQSGHKLAHFGQVEGTGKDLFVSGISWFRFENGKIAEMWVYDDVLSNLIKIGAIPVPASIS